MAMTPNNEQMPNNWQQQTLEKLLLENLKEQRSKRRWGIFFKLVFLAWLLIFLWALFASKSDEALKPHVGVVDIKGEIADDSASSASNVVASLNAALKDKKTIAVILRINSPGGSPVQANEIYNSIIRLRSQYPTKKIYAVCSDSCTSAAYYSAVASDAIYVNPSSIVGSIGVLYDGFGFVGTMDKLGVERRLITSGSEKGFLDQFSPLKPQDVQYTKQILDVVHEQFIAAVKKGRGARLVSTDPNLFSGLAWSGAQAKQMGLVDDFGSVNYVAQVIIKNDNIVNYTKKVGFFDQFSQNLGASLALTLASKLGLNSNVLR